MNQIRLTVAVCAAAPMLALGAGAPTASAAPTDPPPPGHHAPLHPQAKGAANDEQFGDHAIAARNARSVQHLIATNLLGMNTPAIMATEAQYEEMWAQDVAAMLGYHHRAPAG